MSYTIPFTVLVVVLVVVLNYYFGEDDQTKTSNRQYGRTNNIVVSSEMIQRVREVAPDLSESQIRNDLRLTGSVDQTVERFFNGVLLPDVDNTGSGNAGVGNIKESKSSLSFEGSSYEEKKQQLIKENRRKFVEKHGY